jgi:hypothetical protein
MTTQVWGLLGSSKIIFDRTDGNIWKVTVPFLESGEYIVALYALDDAGNQAYVATILYVVDLENLRYEIKMLDYASEAQTTGFTIEAQTTGFTIEAQTTGFTIEAQLQKYSIEQERLERRAAYFAENTDAANV